MEYPEDICVAARKAIDENEIETNDDDGWHVSSYLLERMVCAAILADRRRAEAAATKTITRLLGDPLADSINGYVAAAIRGEP